MHELAYLAFLLPALHHVSGALFVDSDGLQEIRNGGITHTHTQKSEMRAPTTLEGGEAAPQRKRTAILTYKSASCVRACVCAHMRVAVRGSRWFMVSMSAYFAMLDLHAFARLHVLTHITFSQAAYPQPKKTAILTCISARMCAWLHVV